MAGKGGYQRPTSPAPVSAPGSLSQRTDGGPGAMQGAKYIAGLPYGQGQEFQDMQQMAPMEAAQSTPSASSEGSAPAQLAQGAPLTPLHAPSERPNEPVTAGVDAGPGPGTHALTLSLPSNQLAGNQLVASYLPDLIQAATLKNAPDSYRRFVNYLVSQL